MKKTVIGSYCGRDVCLWTIGNENLEVGVTDLGASIQYIRFRTANGLMRDLCLGYSSPEERIKSGTYCGAVIGRVSNRIAGGRFELNGKRYSLSKNDGNNTLHGGESGFDGRFFYAEYEDDALVMRHVSPDGDQGFPGLMLLVVSFRVVNNSLCIEFLGASDQDTVWAPTIHPYFFFGTVKDNMKTLLQIHADKYMPLDGEQIPTGEISDVEGTPFDFRQPKPIGKDLKNHKLKSTRGYDHNFVIRQDPSVREQLAATVINEESGVKMEVYSDMCGLHFYTGNFLNGFNGVRQFQAWDGFALEPQFFPNSVNLPGFIQPILQADKPQTHSIRYTFSALG